MLRKLESFQEPTKFVDTLWEIILSNNIKILIVEHYHFENFHVLVSLNPWRHIPHFSHMIGIRGKMCMKRLLTGCIQDI